MLYSSQEIGNSQVDLIFHRRQQIINGIKKKSEDVKFLVEIT